MDDIKLLPLPAPYGWITTDGFTADQMTTHAAACYQAGLAAGRAEFQALGKFYITNYGDAWRVAETTAPKGTHTLYRVTEKEQE